MSQILDLRGAEDRAVRLREIRAMAGRAMLDGPHDYRTEALEGPLLDLAVSKAVGLDAVIHKVDNAPKPFFFMSRTAAEKLRKGAKAGLPNFGATTTVSLQRAFDDDEPLYDQAALDAAVLAERDIEIERLRHEVACLRAELTRRGQRWADGGEAMAGALAGM